ncbi:MAG TPA: AAA family ATPase, partial [Pirellulales bacterium]|nr:AAA family ATPase [Pirellulales bacterium]
MSSSFAAAASPVWDFSVNPNLPERISADVQVRIAGDVAPRDVAWLAGGRIPLEAVTIVAGAEGAGKSFFAAELAAQVSRGAAAVYAHGADLAPGWLRARLDAAGANADRVAMVELGWPTGSDEPTIQELLDRLVATASVARASHDCRLLVVDHLEAWAGELDQPGSPARMNYALAKLAEIARRLQIAVVALVRLPNHRGGQAARALARVSSIAPVVWLAAEDEDRPGRRLLVNVKNNLGAKRPGEAFEIVDNR